MHARILGSALAMIAVSAGWAAAQADPGAAAPSDAGGPVVVELFTSQGCAACPAADDMLAELAAVEGVLPLALHVDYWDYIGWEDTFGSPMFTARQQAYAMAVGERMVYTPQLIVGGRDRVIGADPMAVLRYVQAQAESSDPVALTLSRSAHGFTISAVAVAPLGAPLTVQFARFIPHAEVEIMRGENAGMTQSYVNIVTDWQVLGNWDGAMPLDVTVPAQGDDPAVVLLQEPGPGAIVAAEVLR